MHFQHSEKEILKFYASHFAGTNYWFFCTTMGWHMQDFDFQLTERVWFIFLPVVMCKNFFLIQICVQDIFFQNHPTPPPPPPQKWKRTIPWNRRDGRHVLSVTGTWPSRVLPISIILRFQECSLSNLSVCFWSCFICFSIYFLLLLFWQKPFLFFAFKLRRIELIFSGVDLKFFRQISFKINTKEYFFQVRKLRQKIKRFLIYILTRRGAECIHAV